MSKYVLDSDIIIYFLKGVESVVEKISIVAASQLFTTVINYSELSYGAYHSTNPQSNLRKLHKLMSNLQVLPMDIKAADLFGQFKATSRKSGVTIADMDLLIAAIAVANDYILVTNNIKHFNTIQALKVENWYRS